MSGFYPDTTLECVHPGELVGEWLQENHYSQGWLAAQCTISASYISDVVQGKRGIGPRLALRLQRVTAMSPRLLVRMQADWDLEQEWQRQVGIDQSRQA